MKHFCKGEFYMATYTFKLISLLGGLALFLFGMDVMGKALGGRLQTILAKMSSNVFKGFLLGLGVTGAVTYGSAIPIILGQNIATCVTAMMGAIGANRKRFAKYKAQYAFPEEL